MSDTVSPMGRMMQPQVLLLLALLVISAFSTAVTSEGSQVHLEIQIDEASAKDWYQQGDIISLSANIVNEGASQSIETDPSCDVIIQVINSNQELVYDESDSCRGQSQNIDFESGEIKQFTGMGWDLKDSAGAYASSGFYTIKAVHPTTDLSDALEVEIQTSIETPQQLELILTISNRQQVILDDQNLILGVSLYNPTKDSVTLPDESACKLISQIGDITTLQLPCFSSRNNITAGEHVLLGNILIPASQTDSGDLNIEVFNVGKSLSQSMTVDISQSGIVGLEEMANGLQTDIVLQANDNLFSEGEIFESSLLLTNIGESERVLTFTNTCKAEMWIIDDRGRVVFDSRMTKTCSEIEVDNVLSSNEQLVFTLVDWSFTDLQGCEVPSGTYNVIVEIPQYYAASSHQITYERVSATDCASPLDLEIVTHISSSNNNLDITIDLLPKISEVELRWVGPCAVSANIYDDSGQEVHRQRSLCDDRDGRLTLLKYEGFDKPTIMDIGGVAMIDMMQNDLPDGDYVLKLELQTNPISLVQIEFSWPLSESQQSVIVDNTETQLTPDSRVLTGFWSGVITESGTCWIFNSNEEGQILLSRAVGGWAPQQGWSGAYQVQNTEVAPECRNFNIASIQVTSVESESPEHLGVIEGAEEDKTIAAAVQEEVITIAPTILIIASTTSILSMLVLVTLNTESIRIPSTAAGLWFLGLIGKTHETTDGRFQRGRLMGYLTANPGCHFRALMGALEMSNGQITHHLRILEKEESIWRRKDGRLVRFYPLTNQLQPHMIDDLLPVPPLSPDPNSLQGKILSLLDNDGTLGDFPTQSELADRLEKSQQLVSHHLRTLQKFGLVEKRKMGMRNRYKLTREAIFLLETNDGFSKED